MKIFHRSKHKWYLQTEILSVIFECNVFKTKNYLPKFRVIQMVGIVTLTCSFFRSIFPLLMDINIFKWNQTRCFLGTNEMEFQYVNIFDRTFCGKFFNKRWNRTTRTTPNMAWCFFILAKKVDIYRRYYAIPLTNCFPSTQKVFRKSLKICEGSSLCWLMYHNYKQTCWDHDKPV